MAFGDKNDVAVALGDLVEYNGSVYILRNIELYDFVTVAVLEDLKTHVIHSPLLRDIVKL
jgi:hypothetical protein